MKITIYELLGMVKDGKAPKKIKINNDILTLSKATIIQYNFERMGHLNWDYYIENNMLNEKIVEILDDKEKGLPEKINDWISTVGKVDDSNIEGYVHILFEQQTQLYCKINQLIDYLEKQRKGE